MKISTKLQIGFGLLLLIMISMVVFSMIQLTTLKKSIDSVVNDRYPKTVIVNQTLLAIKDGSIATRDLALNNDPNAHKEFLQIIENVNYKVSDNLNKLSKVIKSEKGKEILQKITYARKNYIDSRNQYKEMLKNNQTQQAFAFLTTGQLKTHQELYLKELNNLIEFQNEMMITASKITIENEESAYIILEIIGIVGLILGIIIAFKLIQMIIKPINKLVLVANDISNGKLSVEIDTSSKDETGDLSRAFKIMLENINKIVAEVDNLTNEIQKGKLDFRSDSNPYNGDWKKTVVSINSLVDSFVAPINVTAEYVDRISKGDMPPIITENYYGDFNEIKMNLNTCINSINALIVDSKILSKAAIEGKLNTRADSSKHFGDFRVIVDGFNNTLDAVINPLNVAANFVDQISNGVIPNEITDSYNGEFNIIKHNLNTLRFNINEIIRQILFMSEEHNLGEIDKRIESNKFIGSWKEMAEGINIMVDSHIQVNKNAMNVVLDYGNGNFNSNLEKLPGKKVFINETLNKVQFNLLNVSKELNDLINFAKNGQLDARGDISKYQGDWKNMIEGLNELLNSIVEPINESSEVLATMAQGDLTARMSGKYNGEFDLLKTSINELGNSLCTAMLQVVNSVQTTSSTANQLSSTAETMAASAQEQSSQADEVASAVEQMSRTVTENAHNASKTASFAQENGTIAKEGGEVVQLTIQKMRDIANVVQNSANNIHKLGESSKEIGEIVSVIDDIADQTNLLALNAAIEAARAGEQGRGFAVVADEVRKLAERTTSATKQIANMIKGIQYDTQEAVQAMNQGNNEVQDGIQLADKAGYSLREILKSSQLVLDMINQIASANEEQSATAEQISKNVVSISKVSNENAMQIEEIARSSDSLTQQTEILNNLISHFRVFEESLIDSNYKKGLLGKNKNQLNSRN